MRTTVKVKDHTIQSRVDLPDGFYDMDIKEKDRSRTYEQIKKLWATIDDISRAEYGDVSQSESIYFHILQMSGIDTYKIPIPENALADFRKKVKSLRVLTGEVVNGQPYVVVQVCLKGISEMSKKELSQVIDTAIRWCAELGIESELHD